MSEGEAQDGHREGTQGFGGKLGCTSNVILLEIWSEGKDHCSCTLSQVPMLSPLPPSLPLREYPRCRLNLTPQFLWRHAVGWEWTLGGARKNLSYFSDLPQKNVSHFEAFLYQKKKKKKASLCDNTKGQSSIFLQKGRKPCTISSLPWSAGRHVFRCSTHVQTGFSYWNSFKVSQAGSICAGKLKSCKTIRQCLQMVPAARRYESHMLSIWDAARCVRSSSDSGLVATCYLVTQGEGGQEQAGHILSSYHKPCRMPGTLVNVI